MKGLTPLVRSPTNKERIPFKSKISELMRFLWLLIVRGMAQRAVTLLGGSLSILMDPTKKSYPNQLLTLSTVIIGRNLKET